MSTVSASRLRRIAGAVGLAAALAAGIGLVATAADAPAAGAGALTDDGAAQANWQLLGDYCSGCHNVTDYAGGVSFDVMDRGRIPQDAEVWEHAVRKLRGRLMPPPGSDQPDNLAIRRVVAWLENTIDSAAAARPWPGHVGVHRLNRREYANAVADLLDLHIDASALLPTDDVADGFDNIARALQVSPSFLEQSLAAARSVAVQAVGDPAARPAGTSYVARNLGTQQDHREGLPLGTRGGMVVEHNFPADGEYQLNVGNLAVGLWVYNMEFDNALLVTLDGRTVYETHLGGEADQKAIDQQQEPAVDAINARLKNIRFKATAGPHKVAVTFRQRTYAESEDRLSTQVPGSGQDRVLRIRQFEIRGPFNATGVGDTPSRRRLFVCRPAATAEQDACATRILMTLARRAFRRPVTDDDLGDARAAYAQGFAAGGFDTGIRRGVTSILADPRFLFRVERVPAGVPDGRPYALPDIELASRLSFFLWSSVPDETLLQAAEAGTLHQPAQLQAQVRRMLADPRARSLTSSFAFQWLNVARLAEIEPDATLFPYAARARDADGDLREDMRTELTLFVDSVFREDRSVVDLLTADHTYLNERLALHYGVNDLRGDRFRRVTLHDAHRFGLLGKAAVLMLTSYPTRTAPVLRGEWILNNITGTPPSPPPQNVKSLRENVAGQKALTVRELMAQHSTDKSCHACHGVMDPLGLALENFDATGQWRAVDRQAQTAIDAAGVLPDGAPVNSPEDLRRALTRQPEQFVQTFTEKLLTYALGRSLDYRDMPAVRAIVRDTARDGYRFSSIVQAIVASAAFRESEAPRDGARMTARIASVGGAAAAAAAQGGQ